jgi:hypothetical protein
MSLRDAVENLNSKIASSAGGATAEEIAYLATAAERIGGRVSIFELSEFAEAKKTELSVAAATAISNAASTVNSELADHIAQMATARDQALESLSASRQATDTLIAQITTDTSLVVASTAATLNASTQAAASAAAQVTADADALVAVAVADAIDAVATAAAQAVSQILGQRGRMMFFTTF